MAGEWWTCREARDDLIAEMRASGHYGAGYLARVWGVSRNTILNISKRRAAEISPAIDPIANAAAARHPAQQHAMQPGE